MSPCVRNLSAITLAATLVAYFWWQGERFIAANGPTFDEGVHLTAGYVQWAQGDFTFNREDPPLLKYLWAAPLWLGEHPPYPEDVATATRNNHWHIADAFLYHSGSPPDRWFAPARRMNLALGCMLILLVGWWAYRIANSRCAGIAACAFAAFDPTLLALSCVLTTDLGVTLFTLLSAYVLWEYSATPRLALLIASGISLGLLFGSKFSAIAAVAGLGLAGLVFVLNGGTLALPGQPAPSDLRSRLVLAGELALRLVVIAAATLAAIYGVLHFDQWGAGLKFQLTRGDFGDGVAYLNGEISRNGWFHYFLVVLPMKLPLGLLIAVVLASLGCCARASSQRGVWLIIPPLVIFAAASIARVNLGVRVVAPVVPFLYIHAARLGIPGCCAMIRWGVLGACLAWCGIASWYAAPHQIAYFNELAGGSRGGLNFAADSNLDWGQGLPQLKAYMEREGIEVVYLAYFGTDRPDAYGIRYQMLPNYGRIGPDNGECIPRDAHRHVVVVSANHRVGLMLNDPETYAWLRSRSPTTVLGGSLYIHDITGDDAAIAAVRRLAATANCEGP